MQKLAIILTLIDIALIVGPIAGTALLYSNDLQGMVIPTELNEVINPGSSDGGGNGGLLDLLNPDSKLTLDNSTQNQLQISPPVVTEVDFNARSVTFSFNFTNPLPLDFTLQDLNGTVQCKEHNFVLGTAVLNGTVPVKASATTTVSVTFRWTQEGENHYLSAHTGDSTIDVQLINTKVNLSGIEITIAEPIDVPGVPLGPV